MRYIHISTPVFHRSGATYVRRKQKFPSKTLRKRVGSGTYQRNRWGHEAYVKRRAQAELTREQQASAVKRWEYMQEIANQALDEDDKHG